MSESVERAMHRGWEPIVYLSEGLAGLSGVEEDGLKILTGPNKGVVMYL